VSAPEPAAPSPPGTDGGGPGVDIRSFWTLLTPETRQWLMDHTGADIVPRAVTAAMRRAADQPVPQDAHGQARLNEDDMHFIRTRAHSAYAAHGTECLFDAVQPEDTGHRWHGRPGAD